MDIEEDIRQHVKELIARGRDSNIVGITEALQAIDDLEEKKTAMRKQFFERKALLQSVSGRALLKHPCS